MAPRCRNRYSRRFYRLFHLIPIFFIGFGFTQSKPRLVERNNIVLMSTRRQHTCYKKSNLWGGTKYLLRFGSIGTVNSGSISTSSRRHGPWARAGLDRCRPFPCSLRSLALVSQSLLLPVAISTIHSIRHLGELQTFMNSLTKYDTMNRTIAVAPVAISGWWRYQLASDEVGMVTTAPAGHDCYLIFVGFGFEP